MSQLQFAPEVAEIAADLIANVERHEQLANVRIEYLFIDKAPTSHGRVTLGRARKVTGLAAFLAAFGHAPAFEKPSPFFVVEISYDIWLGMTDKQRIALVDHELCHLCCDPDDGDLFTKGHDLEEFIGIVERHGFWKADVADFSVAVAKQLTFDLDAADLHLATP